MIKSRANTLYTLHAFTHHFRQEEDTTQNKIFFSGVGLDWI